jgi:carboxymethylenebutenolidase
MCHPEVPAGDPIPEITRQRVEIPLRSGEKMPATFCHPADGPGPGVMVLTDIWGMSPFYDDLTARLAQAGFTAVCPEYFFRQGDLPERVIEEARARRLKTTTAGAMADYNDTIEWLKTQAATTEKVGVVGFCLGGTYVFLLNADRDDTVGVAYYGFPKDPAATPQPLDVMDKMKAPLLGFWGENDPAVGMPNVEAFDKGLTAAGVDHKFTVFEGIGHGFLGATKFDPEQAAYEAACDSWAESLDFFRSNLRTPVTA